MRLFDVSNVALGLADQVDSVFPPCLDSVLWRLSSSEHPHKVKNEAAVNSQPWCAGILKII